MNHRTWRGRVFIGVSLDGYIARPDGAIDWLTDPPSLGRRHQPVTSSAEALSWDTFFPTIDHMVMGRATYEKILTFGEWPFSHKKVIVLSTTLAPTDPNIRVARSIDEACAVLDDGAAEVYVDGGQVIQGFLDADLIDEITVSVAPVIIGQGLPLFGRLARDVHLELRASNATDSGMVSTTYKVHKGGTPGDERSTRP